MRAKNSLWERGRGEGVGEVTKRKGSRRRGCGSAAAVLGELGPRGGGGRRGLRGPGGPGPRWAGTRPRRPADGQRPSGAPGAPVCASVASSVKRNPTAEGGLYSQRRPPGISCKTGTWSVCAGQPVTTADRGRGSHPGPADGTCSTGGETRTPGTHRAPSSFGCAPPASSHHCCAGSWRCKDSTRRVQRSHLSRPNVVLLGAQPLTSGKRAMGGPGPLCHVHVLAMSLAPPRPLPFLWVVAGPLHGPTPNGALRPGRGQEVSVLGSTCPPEAQGQLGEGRGERGRDPWEEAEENRRRGWGRGRKAAGRTERSGEGEVSARRH
ncbi:collagen alpha-1(I) chain-like isoform X1 [Camelus ferus]|uniref:Collagen alpha-1(I) chain-like isoform X1 n=1 Tax=Camelus ferus TaxID=419612 RepID=A0A8B8U177_CAMFR|nr:collagen alpha-1(I) chain-like isoform X1 [Camelus ferus]